MKKNIRNNKKTIILVIGGISTLVIGYTIGAKVNGYKVKYGLRKLFDTDNTLEKHMRDTIITYENNK